MRLRGLAEKITEALRGRMEETPLLDEVMPQARPAAATIKVAAANPPLPPRRTTTVRMAAAASGPIVVPRTARTRTMRPRAPRAALIVGGIAAVAVVAVLGVFLLAGGNDTKPAATGSALVVSRPGTSRKFVAPTTEREAPLDDALQALKKKYGGSTTVGEATPRTGNRSSTGRAEHASGVWKIAGKELVQESQGNECLLLFGDLKWTDYDLELEAMPTQGIGELNAVVRAAGVGDRTVAVLGGWNNTRHGVFSIAGGSGKGAVVVAGTTTPGRWQKISVEVRGRVCRLLIDDKVVIGSADVPAAAGRVGLRTVGTAGRFRNIKVTDPKGKVLFEGLPELPAARP